MRKEPKKETATSINIPFINVYPVVFLSFFANGKYVSNSRSTSWPTGINRERVEDY